MMGEPAKEYLSNIRTMAGRGRALKAALLASCALPMLAGAAGAADWTGATSVDWFVGSNWSTGTVPMAADVATIDTDISWVTAPGAEAIVVVVGDTATGELLVWSGGTLEAGSHVTVGASAGSEGTVTVQDAGSTIIGGDTMTFGGLGHAELRILDGGVVDTSAASPDGRVFVGLGSTGSGFITIGGTGSAFRSSGELILGFDGSAELIAADGARVDAGWNFAAGDGALKLGAQAGGIGSATFIDEGTLLAASHHVVVGDAGTGVLNVISGADATVAGRLSIGQSADGTGFVSVQGTGSTVSVNGAVLVGDDGSGSLLIGDGGVLQGNAVMNVGVHGTGTVTVTGAGSSLTIANGIEIGASGEGALTIAEGGTVTIGAGTGTLDLALNAGSTGTLNIGAAAGDAAVEAGELNAAAVTFGDGDGTINFNHDLSSVAAAPVGGYDFSAVMSGSGTVNHIAGTTTFSGVSTGFTGTTNVTGGELFIGGMLGGAVNVEGGRLGGSGTLFGNVTIESGGTIAPGNSIGTLSLVSDITFNAGSVYEVELNDGGFVAGTNNDFIFIGAGGSATINGGTVHVTPVSGGDDGSSYTPGTYTILTAGGGVTGMFDTLTDDYAFLSFELDYDLNNVYLISALNPITTFCLSGMSANECATGDTVFALGSGDVYTAVLNLSDAEAPGALDQLSGEIHASAKTALTEDSRFVREAALDRIRQAFADTGTDEGTGLWMHGFGARGQIDGDGNAAALDRSTGGFFIGADGEVIDNWNFGVLAGYSHSSFNVDERASSGSADSYHLGAYGGTEWNDLAFRFGGAYSWHDMSVNRSVAFTGFSDSLSSDYWAGTGQLFGELGYGIDAGSAHFEPFANLAWVNHRTNGFTEQGGAAALTGAEDVINATFTTLGARASTELAMGEGTKARLTGMAGWRHAFGDTPTSTLNFAGGAPFTVAGVPLAKNTLVLEAGLNLDITPMATLGFNYSGQIGSGISDHALKANLGVKF
ncbi:autotransporter domain-containing protein [Stappia sp. P2PMeth1]|uniref:autotransporter outer membrane beta-barrel domain-containing protein n=1 Tax=Stappia sp. P2PMeth1 TaxID=2003586 RepID=UPI0016457B6A|nr:autotransporter domain-containing protein [Stappia sp. P2PMeth1]